MLGAHKKLSDGETVEGLEERPPEGTPNPYVKTYARMGHENAKSCKATGHPEKRHLQNDRLLLHVGFGVE